MSGGNRYTHEDIERGLAELAICAGNSRLAVRRLERRGQRIPRGTLRRWAELTHADRFQEIRAQLLPKIYDRIADEAEEIITLEAEAEKATLERYNEIISELPPREVAGALRNLSVSKGVNLDKSSAIRGRPSQIVEHHRPLSELYLRLKDMGLLVDEPQTIDAEAVEDDVEQLPPAA